MPQEFIMQMRPWFGAEEKQALMAYMDEDGFLRNLRKQKPLNRPLLITLVPSTVC